MKSFATARCANSLAAARNAIPRSTRALTTIAARPTCLRSSQLSQSQARQHPSRTVAATPVTRQSRRHQSTETEALSKTSLYDFHVRNGATMVPFAGYSMPVIYKDMTMLDSHLHTRKAASIFDVGHMVQHHFSGPGATAFLEKISPSDVKGLAVHSSTLSTLLWPSGGIVDDLIITKLWEDRFYVVTNAGCREKDLKFIGEQLKEFDGGEVEWNILEGQGLIALQGPKAKEILGKVVADPEGDGNLDTLYFGQSRYMKVKSLSLDRAGPFGFQSSLLLVSRGGYTGEDGFEISIPAQETEAVTQLLLEAGGQDTVKLAGLGARDSLRLEAGMCLYGHDLNDDITPVEAALSWVIAKRRREEANFNGAEKILAQLKPKSKGGQGVEKRRVGFLVTGPPAREGAEIQVNGKVVGAITSGCPSPCLKKNIAMGFIQDGLHKSGTDVDIIVRGKARKGVVSKMPFLATNYYKKE